MPGYDRNGWRRLALVALLIGGFAALPTMAAADQVRVDASLIRASNDAAPARGRQNETGQKLKHVLNFQSYQNYGGGSTVATVPSTATISLGHGNNLTIRLAPASGNRIQAGINWSGPSGQVLNTTVVMTRGVPVILGGGQQDGATMMISVTVR